VKGQSEDGLDERFGEVKGWVRSLVRVRGRKSNMLQECFNLSQLPSPDEGLVFYPAFIYRENIPTPHFILISINVNITGKTPNSPHQMPNVVTEKSDLMAQTTPTNIALIWRNSVLFI
jgi:hypothetical protein